jgi:hypothetical protein
MTSPPLGDSSDAVEGPAPGRSNSVASHRAPGLKLERISSNASRVLQKTISQASSIKNIDYLGPRPVDRALLENASKHSGSADGININSSGSSDNENESSSGKNSSDQNRSKPGISHSVSFQTGDSTLIKRIRPRLMSPLPSCESVPIYRGSYTHSNISGTLGTPSHSRPVSIRQLSSSYINSLGPDTESPHLGHSRNNSLQPQPPGSPFLYASFSQNHLEALLGQNDEPVRETFGVEELRNGFFDAVFVPRTLIERLAYNAVKAAADDAADSAVDETSAGATDLKKMINRAVNSMRKLVHLFLRIHSFGCPPFAKAFMAYMVCYILCLVKVVGNWLGQYCYFMCLAAILHHAGHSSGNQLEITAQTIIGGALGLGWGALAVYVSSSTSVANNGYGGILAAFTIVIVAITAWFRASFIRLYHGIIAFSYIFISTTIFETGELPHNWRLLWDIGIPYLMGVLLVLLVNLMVMPDFGHTSILNAFSDLLVECRTFIHDVNTGEVDDISDKVDQLNAVSMELSLVFREMCNEVTISTLHRNEALDLRNKLQVCVGRLRIITSPEFLIEGVPDLPAYLLLKDAFVQPSRQMIKQIHDSFKNCELYFSYLHGVTPETEGISFFDVLDNDYVTLKTLQNQLITSYRDFSQSQDLSDSHLQNPKVVDMLLYVHYLSDACHAYMEFLSTVRHLSTKKRSWKFSFIKYPLERFLKINTRQTAHDRGGQSAFYFFHTMRDVQTVFKKIANIPNAINTRDDGSDATFDSHKLDSGILNVSNRDLSIRHRIWAVLHRLQQHETRFALRTSITILLLCLPAYINSSRGWYNKYDVWIAPLIALVVLHPRVGGSLHDLVVRSFFAVIGVVWAAIGHRADNGNAYVLAVFAGLFMGPHFYRFVQSSHPRSGLIACISFTLVSQSMYQSKANDTTIIKDAWTRGVAIIVGVTSSIFINWIFWPFVARHEVRKGMAIVLLYLSQSYQIVADRYLYKYQGNDPDQWTIALSEIREARLRSGKCFMIYFFFL